MRVALISDIHGDTIALDAILTEIAAERFDVAVCLGDLAANGPDPAGAIDLIGAWPRLRGACFGSPRAERRRTRNEVQQRSRMGGPGMATSFEASLWSRPIGG